MTNLGALTDWFLVCRRNICAARVCSHAGFSKVVLSKLLQNSPKTKFPNLFWVGDGGLHTSVDDMLLWDQNFYTPKVGKEPKKLLALFNKPNSDFDARGGKYANGQMITDNSGRASYAHGGGWLGVLTYYERFPEEEFSTVIFCNTTDQKPWVYAKQIAELYFSAEEKPE